ncbi:uncharacterized protein LOC143299951 [Babylonia areolata]|uniref:uncharacterized protein LOC143299951 n=1 Tax=Babylonia areolata TaxID=304850 RepID=UPI003FCF1495
MDIKVGPEQCGHSVGGDREGGKDQPLKTQLDSSEAVGYHGNIVDSGIAGDEKGEWGCGERGANCQQDEGQLNGDIFSPDSADMVTVICASEEGRVGREEERDRDGWEGSDTHSDSIETLEEESPQDTSQDSIGHSAVPHMCLASGEGQEIVPPPSLGTGQAGEDSLSMDSHEVIPDVAATVAATRPESLPLARPLQGPERTRSSSEPQQGVSRAQAVRAEGHQRTRSEALDIQAVRVRGDLSYGDDIMSRSLPHGTLTRKGALVEFVADDLTEKIRRSSPMSGADSGSMGSRRSSQRSLASTSSATSAATSSGVSRSPSSLLTQSPDAAPPIDPAAIMELEMAARHVADNVDHMMGNLRNNLHKMSAITVGCSEAYKTSVDITCESVDSSIKSMYALMAKCEELSKTMAPVYQIGTQIKEIKRLLDRFEAQLSEKP